MAGLAADDVAEQVPVVALEAHHLKLLDRGEIVGRGVNLEPGNSVSDEKSLRLAACFITLARVRSSPHISELSPGSATP